MTGDAQRRVAEVLADGIEEGLTDYDANVDPALFALAVARRTTPAILAVLAAEGLLVGDGPVAGGNGALSAQTGAAGHPDQDDAAGAQE